mmetsp:Transcript_180814/g.440000  ORF Transcript_180814/g.440000 Transcript_180814/m.440000 type:complete len:328 (-) Transcript_180814:341-1324(-)
MHVLVIRPRGFAVRREQQFRHVEHQKVGGGERHRHVLVRVGSEAHGQRGAHVVALGNGVTACGHPVHAHVCLVDVRHVDLNLVRSNAIVHGVIGSDGVRDNEALHVRFVLVVSHAVHGNLLRCVPVGRREGKRQRRRHDVVRDVVRVQIHLHDHVLEGFRVKHDLVRHRGAVLRQLDDGRQRRHARLVVLSDGERHVQRHRVVEPVRAGGGESDDDHLRHHAVVDVVVHGANRHVDHLLGVPLVGDEGHRVGQRHEVGELREDHGRGQSDVSRRVCVEREAHRCIVALVHGHFRLRRGQAGDIDVDRRHLLRLHSAVEQRQIAQRGR